MRKIQSWLWIWVFWAFLLGGCSKAVGTFESGESGADQSGDASGQVASAANSSSEVSVTELAGDPLPVDLVIEPSFSTKGYVFARESYTNESSHPVKLWPSSHASSLVLKSQFRGQGMGGPLNSYETTLGLSLAVTSNQTPTVMERLSDSIMGSSITLAPGEKVILNWRVGPAPGSGLCIFESTITGQILGNSFSLTTLMVGSALDLNFQREVQAGDDKSHLEDLIPSESPSIHSSSGGGILNPEYTPPLICNGIYTNLMGSSSN